MDGYGLHGAAARGAGARRGWAGRAQPGAGAALGMLQAVLEDRDAVSPGGWDWWRVAGLEPGGLTGLVDGRHRTVERVGVVLESGIKEPRGGGSGSSSVAAGVAQGAAFSVEDMASSMAAAGDGAAFVGGGMVDGGDPVVLGWPGFGVAFGEVVVPGRRWRGPWREMPVLDVPVWPELKRLRGRLRKAGMRLDAAVMRELLAEAVRFSHGGMSQPLVNSLLLGAHGAGAEARAEGERMARAMESAAGWLEKERWQALLEVVRACWRLERLERAGVANGGRAGMSGRRVLLDRQVVLDCLALRWCAVEEQDRWSVSENGTRLPVLAGFGEAVGAAMRASAPCGMKGLAERGLLEQGGAAGRVWPGTFPG